jgi:hypothetical protein
MLFRCVAAIPNGGGNCVEHFYPDTPEGHQSAEAFAQQYNRDGWGVYDCVSLLKEKRRAKDTVAEIAGLHWDIDARQVNEPKVQVIERVREKLKAFGLLSRLIDSGRGVHVYSTFKEPIDIGTPEADKAHQLLRRMAAYLGADMAPTHFAALMRRVGTTNSKEGGGPCKVELDTGMQCDPSDVAAFLELVDGAGSLFAKNQEQNEREPVDVEAELAAMKFEDDEAGVNATYCRVIMSMIWKAEHPANIAKRIVDTAMRMAERMGLQWDRSREETRVNKSILSAYRVFQAEYDATTGVIPVWLPMEFHEQWAAVLAEGGRPTMDKRRFWFVAGGKKTGANDSDVNTDRSEARADADDSPKAPFILRPIKKFDLAGIPPREFLFGRHYQRRTVSGTVAPGGTGKSSLVMVEAIAMATGRDLLGEGAKVPLKAGITTAKTTCWNYNGAWAPSANTTTSRWKNLRPASS